MNPVFLFLLIVSFLVAGWHQLVDPMPVAGADGTVPPQAMEALTNAMFGSAKGAVELAIGLIGPMTLFLGLMKVGEAGGLMQLLANALRPLLRIVFPAIPSTHPAMGAMVMNFSANGLGLGNAATPFGIRAITELQKLNGSVDTASHAMITFLAINMSHITLLPSGVIGIRAAMGSADPAGVLPTTLFATACSATTAITLSILASRWTKDTASKVDESVDAEASLSRPWPLWASVLVLAGIAACIPLTVKFGKVVSPWMIPVIALSLVGFGIARKVNVYEVFVEGAKDGFQVAIRITPFVVGILVAVGMFRASGALEVFTSTVGPFTAPFGLPPEALPMVIVRPLSGSGAMAVMMATMQQSGVDSYVGYLVSTINGCTETIFYTMAVYFGSVGIKRSRHLLAIALCAETAGVIGAVIACKTYLGLW